MFAPARRQALERSDERGQLDQQLAAQRARKRSWALIGEALPNSDGRVSQLTNVETANGGVSIFPLEENRQPPPHQGMERVGYDDAVAGDSLMLARSMR
jgi:hypothetical protein